MASGTRRAVGPAPTGAPHLLFLSHAGIDSEAALRLARRLEACEEAQTHGLKVWIDQVDLGAGGRWKDALQAALADSTAFAVYVGSPGVVHWVWDQLNVALDRVHKDPVAIPTRTAVHLQQMEGQRPFAISICHRIVIVALEPVFVPFRRLLRVVVEPE